jgi:hypothetical protein
LASRSFSINILTFLFTAVFCSSIWGQKQATFSGDSSKFIGELNGIFVKLDENEKKIIAPMMQSFTLKWNIDEFLPAQKKLIYTICNGMARKKIHAFPDFYNYIRALNVFVESRQPREKFYTWSRILARQIAAKNVRPFMTFLECTINLFESNHVYHSSSTIWNMENPIYQFGYGIDSVPLITFDPSNLMCRTREDSLIIYGTSGTYYPLTCEWIGTGGQCNWERAGLDPAQVYATLGDYRILMKFARFDADSVLFFNRKYFTTPLWGRYIDKVMVDVPEERASYPRFYSYEKVISIRDIFKDIDYIGGFAMEGARIIGSGDKNTDARIFIRRDEKDLMIIRSKSFIIRPDRINSALASVAIYHDADSIYHPGLQMKYLDPTREISFSKDERLASISPWFDSWHKIEIYCEALNWSLNEPKLVFGVMIGPGTESNAVFESSNYYSEARYEKLQGIDAMNPLDLIRQYTELRKSREFTLDDLTRYMKKPPEQVEVMLIKLANKGFLVYDMDDKSVRVKDKLFDYVKARSGKSDYDGVFFNSSVQNTHNGILELNTFDLKINGVPEIALSDSQQVHIFPKNQEVVLKKDRDFTFEGKIEAGYFDFFTHQSSFEYDKFRINLPQVDSMVFYVRSKQRDHETGTFPLVRVRSSIVNLSGNLQIDDPKNKSGHFSPPEYPIFTNKNNAYVYWDKPSIQKGVYKKDKFYFEVFPFTINSLDVVDTDSLDFNGYLISAGIFPRIDEPLRVRPDYSLGFEKYTDANGLPLYGTHGSFIHRIDLSDRGLLGDGTFRFLNSESTSPNFVFFPDSMRTIVSNFTATEQLAGVEYPSVKGDSVKEFWLPYRDSLVITTLRTELSMYNDQSSFNGTLALTPRELSGDGMMKIKDAEMDSKGFKFKRRTFDALIANFRIKAYDLADLTICTRNYQTHFDFDQRKGEFRSNVGVSMIEFPLNKYVCSMDRFDWFVDEDEIMLTNERSTKLISESLSLSQLIDVAYTGSEFISVHPLQDSLRFFAARARYNLRTNVINAEEVRIIKVADAAIYPDSGKVRILKDAVIEPLHRSQIISNTKTRYHLFYRSDISIASRKKYSARGYYDYIQRSGERNEIYFDRIRVDTSGQTVAEGYINDSSHFMLSPQFGYYGDVRLDAPVKNLFFDGAFRTVSECLNPPYTFIRFASSVDPGKISLPVSDPPLNPIREKLSLGIMFSTGTNRIYPVFFSKKKSFSDTVMITSSGRIEYNSLVTEFRIADSVKLADITREGRYISFNNSNCMLRGEGKINPGLNTGNFKMEWFGHMDYFLIPDSARLRLAIAINFPFQDAALQKMCSHFESVNLQGIQIFKTPYATAMKNLLDQKEMDRYKMELDLVGKARKFPEVLERTLFIADVTFRYDSVRKAYVSIGSIGIGNIMSRQINRYVGGIIEFERKRNGDDITLFLKLSAEDWYFFNYRNNLLQVISSNLEFNDIIIEAQQSQPERKRVDKLAKGFWYTISTERKKRDFLRKFETSE